jgi:hypothetical protein
MCINTCALCTSCHWILHVRNLENLQSSCRGMPCSVLIWWRWQHSPILLLTLHYFTLSITIYSCWTPELSNLNEYTCTFWQSYHTCSKHVLCNIELLLSELLLSMSLHTQNKIGENMYVRILRSCEDHFSLLWISQQRMVSIWSACAILFHCPVSSPPPPRLQSVGRFWRVLTMVYNTQEKSKKPSNHSFCYLPQPML